MKNIKKTENKYNVLQIVILAIIVIIIFAYTSFSQGQLEKYARYTVKENAEKISSEIDSFVLSAQNGIQLASNVVYQTLQSGNTEDEVIEVLLNHTSFNRITYINDNGDSMSTSGKNENLSDEKYFLEAMSGRSGIRINYESSNPEDYLFEFYSPVYEDNNILGVLMGSFNVDISLRPLLNTSFYGREVIGILCDENGKIITSTLDDIDNTSYIEDIFSNLKIPDNIRESFYSRINNSEVTVFDYKDTSQDAIACVTVNSITGWKIIQIVPPTSVAAIMQQNMSAVHLVSVLIALILFIVIIYIRLDTKKSQKKIIMEKDRVVQNYEQVLMATASDIYKGIRQLDLESGESYYIFFKDHKVNQVKVGNWSEWLENQKKNVHSADFERLRKSLSLENLRVVIEGVSFSENYRSSSKNNKGHFKTYTTTVSIIYVDGRKTAILTTIDNTAAVTNEIEQKQLLASAASIYMSMHYLDFRNDTIKELSCADSIRAITGGINNGIVELLKDVIYKLADEQYFKNMLEFIDFDTIDERMNGEKTISIEFLGKKNNWCRARFIAVGYNEQHKINQVLWVLENIDAEKKRANQLLYLSETDLMTGIQNRGSGERKIKEMVSSGQQGTFCLLDVDKFKSINDNFGHGIGDKVLIAIADCLRESFRGSDVVMRLGGDEFAIFAVGVIKKTSAVMLIERFFDRIANIDIPELGDRKITVSLGAAVKLKDDDIDFDMLYQNADSCTYKSKKITGSAYSFFGE